MSARIRGVRGRRVWDSRGRPTVEAEVRLQDGSSGRGIAPAGASTGSAEALELRDGGDRFGGFDVSRAVASIEGEIAAALVGQRAEPETVDRRLIELDGTEAKRRLGANALVATSLAVAHAAAAAAGEPLWRYLAGEAEPCLPLPEVQIFGGGAHAAHSIDIQDFMIIAVGADDFEQALAWTAEIYRAAGSVLSERGLLAGVADEGGYWLAVERNEAALELLVSAIERAGRAPGTEVGISLDIAASQLWRDAAYTFGLEGRRFDSGALAGYLGALAERYPIVSLEDPFDERDVTGFQAFTRARGADLEIVGDDLLVTRAERIRRAGRERWCNAALIKPNQVGTLTEAREALRAARALGWNTIVSARSGETEDVSIAHLAVGWGADQLKVGSFARSERMAKWNEALRIAERLGGGRLPAPERFPWARRRGITAASSPPRAPR